MKLATLVFTLAFATVAPAIGARETPSAAHAETQYVSVADHRVAYRSIGNGTPILVANRMRGTLDTWDPLFLDSLAKKHRVITFDYPGIGYSEGTQLDDIGRVSIFVAEFATALELEQFVMMGWSWGGASTQAVLLDHPQRVTHAVIIAANPPGPVDRPIQQAFIERALNPVNDLADEEILFFEPKSAVSRAAAKASRDRIRIRHGVDERIPSTPAQIQTYLAAAQAFGADQAGRRAALGQSRTPILVIAGDNDISTAGQNWFPLVGQIPNAQFLFLPQSGHGPQHQYPELAAQYIVEFLAQSSK